MCVYVSVSTIFDINGNNKLNETTALMKFEAPASYIVKLITRTLSEF